MFPSTTTLVSEVSATTVLFHVACAADISSKKIGEYLKIKKEDKTW